MLSDARSDGGSSKKQKMDDGGGGGAAGGGSAPPTLAKALVKEAAFLRSLVEMTSVTQTAHKSELVVK